MTYAELVRARIWYHARVYKLGSGHTALMTPGSFEMQLLKETDMEIKELKTSAKAFMQQKGKKRLISSEFWCCSCDSFLQTKNIVCVKCLTTKKSAKNTIEQIRTIFNWENIVDWEKEWLIQEERIEKAQDAATEAVLSE